MAAAALLFTNQVILLNFGAAPNIVTAAATQVQLSSNDIQSVVNAVIPTGVPAIYGQELGVSFDDPVPSLAKIAALDRAIPKSALTQEQFARYVNVGTKASCEFCCSAPSVIDQSGRDLCGCQHAAAIRGLAKYLITKHPELSDEQILTEEARWKALWYPKDMVAKAIAISQSNGGKLNLAQLAGRLKQGDVDTSKVDQSILNQLPGMVGGC